MKTKFFVILLAICMITSCATYNMIRKLPAPTRDWLEIHSPLMQSKVPLYIDERNLTEEQHFLRLPPEIQAVYMNIFWNIRIQGTMDVFNERLEEINRYLKTEKSRTWKTDRGWVYLICGYPDVIYTYRTGRSPEETEIDVQTSYGSSPFGTRVDGSSTVMVWQYRVQGMFITFRFKHSPPTHWHLEFSNINEINAQRYYIDLCLELFTPPEEGWELWCNILYNLIKEREGK